MQDSAPAHGGSRPSEWVCRFAGSAPPGRSALDLACGHGRHARWLAARGMQVTAVDRDRSALAGLTCVPDLRTRCMDLEDGPWPLCGERFWLVVVTNYLWRPRFPQLVDCVEPGGLLLYETFARGQERIGRPSRAEFLLEPDELFHRLAPGGEILAFEQGSTAELGDPREPVAIVQRVAWRRASPA